LTFTSPSGKILSSEVNDMGRKWQSANIRCDLLERFKQLDGSVNAHIQRALEIYLIMMEEKVDGHPTADSKRD